MAQTINLDITPGLFQPVLHLHQNDVGREFVINVRTKDGYSIPTGATAEVQATKPSGLGFTVAGTLSGESIAFVTTEGMTDEWGRFPAQIQITSGGTVIFAANFIIEVQRNVHPDGTTDGQQGSIIPELTLLVGRVENAAAAVLDTTTEVTTLPAGSQATYSFDEETNTATFGIPQGEAGAGAAGVVANAYSASKTYAVGEYAIHNGNLYRCATAITTAEAFTASHWTQVVLADDVTDLKNDLNNAENVLYFGENVSAWNEWEKGMVNLYANPWTYVSTNGALRNKKGRDIYLNVGTIVGLTDYSTYSYYIGVRRADGTQMWSSGTWLTSDVTLSRDGYYGIMVHRNDGVNLSDADITAIKSLVFIKHINTSNEVKFGVFDGFLRSNGDIGVAGDNVVTTSLISVSGGEKYLIAEKVPSGSIEMHYCFYSDARTFISPRNTYTNTNYKDANGYKIGFTEITVPTNAKYMRITFHSFADGYYHLYKTVDGNGKRLSSGADVFLDSLDALVTDIEYNEIKHNIKASIVLDLATTPVLFNTFDNTMVIPATATVVANKKTYSIGTPTILDLSISTHNTTLLVVLFDVSTSQFSVIPFTSFKNVDGNKYIVCTLRWYPYSSDRIKIDLDCPWVLNGMMYGLTKTNPCITAVAHRGLSYTAPENTIIAFQLARIWGFDYAETDIMFTADDIPVLLHDPTINRTARNADGTELSSTVNIADITYQQALEYDFGIYKGSAFAGTKIPTLDEFVLTCKRLGLKPIIELKTDSNLTQARIESIMAIVDKYGMRRCTGWTSFDNEYLEIVKGLDDTAILMYTTNEALSAQTISICNSLKTTKNRIVFGTMQSGGISNEDALTLATNGIEAQAPLLDDPTAIAQSNMYATWQFSNGAIVGNVLAGYELRNLTY